PENREAVEWLTTLSGDSDVVLQNLRPGSIDELGLGARTLTVRFPLLIYASVWAFGATGPMRLLPGYEPLLQAYSGLMMMNGDEGGPPTRVGTSILDYGTGMWAAIGILAALVRRGVTGRGCVVDASLYETGLAWLKGHHASFSTSGIVPERHRTGSHRVVPFESFETSTGPIIVAAGNDRLFAKLAGVLGHPEWAADPRYATNAERVANKPPQLAAARFLVAAVPAVVLTRPPVPWRALVAVGLTLFTGQFLFQFFGMAKGMPPGLAAIVVQTQAIFDGPRSHAGRARALAAVGHLVGDRQ